MLSQDKNKHSDLVFHCLYITLMIVIFHSFHVSGNKSENKKASLLNLLNFLKFPQFYHLVSGTFRKIYNIFLQDIFENSHDSDSYNTADDDFQFNIDNDAPQLFNKSVRSDLIRDLELSKGFAEVLDSRLAENTG